jgi:predicted permease
MINLKFALRLLWKTPFVTLVAVASLALGIGANAAIYSIFNQILLQPLPVAQPGRLVNFSGNRPNPGSQSCGQAGECDEVYSYPLFQDLQREQTVFSGIAAHVSFGANLAARNRTVSGEGMLVSGSYFPVLGLRPSLGRLLGPDDDRQPGESHVAVLSYAYWETTFGRDAGVLNQTIIINGQAMTVVGVAPRGFVSTTLGSRPQVFVPITMRSLMLPGWKGFDDRRRYWAYLFARLKPGVSLEQAQAGINVPYHAITNNVEASLQQGLSEKTLTAFRNKHIDLKPGLRGQSSVSRDARTPLTLLLAVTGFVLLIACANIANLLLARGASRSGEMAVRLSIGGSRGQLIAQLLAESCLLGLIGGVLSLAVARATLGAMAALLPSYASALNVHLDLRMIAFTAVLALVTALAFGLFPALYATRGELASALRASTGQPSGGRAASRWRMSLATAQIALSMALLGSAGLFTKSLANISRVDLGVKVDHVATFGISPELNGYKPAQTILLLQRLEDQLRQVPGVTGVTSSMVALLAGNNWGTDVNVEGFPSGPDIDNNSRYNEVGPAYFSTLGVPLIAGREFTRADALGAPKVAIVNEAFAKKFNLGANPVGRHMDQGDKKLDTEIVGYVRNAKYSDVKREVPPLFFAPILQDDGIGSAAIYVRTTLDPRRLVPLIPPILAKLDPNLPVEDLRTMPEQVRQNVALDRFITLFSAAFAALATLLASIGLYGVLAYTVAQRTREIGVRMALGAAPSRVRLMILRQVGLMTLIGGVIGLAAAVALGRLAQSQLYQMQGWDAAVLAGAAVMLSLVALGAGLIPALRASRIEPTSALRYE